MQEIPFRQAESRRMSGGGGADESWQRRRGAVQFNTSRCAILTLGKPRAWRATLTKFNMVSLRRVLGSTSRWRAMYAAARSAARAAGRAARGAERAARSAGGAGGVADSKSREVSGGSRWASRARASPAWSQRSEMMQGRDLTADTGRGGRNGRCWRLQPPALQVAGAGNYRTRLHM